MFESTFLLKKGPQDVLICDLKLGRTVGLATYIFLIAVPQS